MSRTFIGSNKRREFESEALVAKKCLTVSYAAENSSVFRSALKVVMVAELFIAGDNREFQAAGAMILMTHTGWAKELQHFFHCNNFVCF